MEKKDTELSEQHAPEKNTDHAFVRVDRDGSPKIPDNDSDDKTAERAREEHAPKK